MSQKGCSHKGGGGRHFSEEDIDMNRLDKTSCLIGQVCHKRRACAREGGGQVGISVRRLWRK